MSIKEGEKALSILEGVETESEALRRLDRKLPSDKQSYTWRHLGVRQFRLADDNNFFRHSCCLFQRLES